MSQQDVLSGGGRPHSRRGAPSMWGQSVSIVDNGDMDSASSEGPRSSPRTAG